MPTISAREFNHDVSAAKRAATTEPVVITDHGRPSHVLLSIEEYQRLSRAPADLVDWLALDQETDLDVGPVGIGLVVPEL
jgi:prevent-host-death family protein